MTKEDREYAGQLRRFIRTQKALLAAEDLDAKHCEEEMAAHRAQMKAQRAYLTALRAESRVERRMLARVQKQLAGMH